MKKHKKGEANMMNTTPVGANELSEDTLESAAGGATWCTTFAGGDYSCKERIWLSDSDMEKLKENGVSIPAQLGKDLRDGRNVSSADLAANLGVGCWYQAVKLALSKYGITLGKE